MGTRSWAGAAATALTVTLPGGTPALASDDRRSGEGERHQVAARTDTVDVRPGDGTCADSSKRCSLRAAVQEANASGGGRVELGAGPHTGAATGTGVPASGGGVRTAGVLEAGRSTITRNSAPVGPDVFQDGTGTGDGQRVPANGG